MSFFANILPGYSFYYDLPDSGRVGGIALYVNNNSCMHRECPQYKLSATGNVKLENKWLKIEKNKNKYIIGGLYRHLNQNVDEFRALFEPLLNTLSNQTLLCLIAGDLNIDLSKCHTNAHTSAYLDTLIMNNFTPTIIMPTRITDTSATIIDHIYYYKGRGKHPGAAGDLKMISGNLLCDLSDHLPNFTILMKNKTSRVNERPNVRIFSSHNKLHFNYALKNSNWSCVYSETDVNTAYDNFINIVTTAYEK